MNGQTSRKIYQTFFLALFLFLLVVGRTGFIKGYPVSLFFYFDPLLSIGTLLSSGTVHRWLILSLTVVVLTLFLGRVFCGWICPLGAINDAVAKLKKRRTRDWITANSPRKLFRTKYYLLVAFLVSALSGTLVLGLLDPLSLFARGFHGLVGPLFDWAGVAFFSHPLAQPGGWVAALLFAGVIVANLWIPRLWCRGFCPLGALLGFLSRWVPFGVRRDTETCTSCNMCDSACGGAAAPSDMIRLTECTVCMNCTTICPVDSLSFGPIGSPLPEARVPDAPGRRMALAALAGVVAWPLLRTSSAPPGKAEAARVRPPGALPEQDFLRRCARCGMCVRSCPTGVIQLATDQLGLEGIWTPVMRFDVGYCELTCVLCGHVCPTGAIEQLTPGRKTGTEEPGQEPVRIGTAFYDRGRCLPWAMGKPCVVCEEVCPVSPKAIWSEKVTVVGRDGTEVTLTRPYVDSERCTGCGICQYHCPVEDMPAIRVTAVGESRGEPFIL